MGLISSSLLHFLFAHFVSFFFKSGFCVNIDTMTAYTVYWPVPCHRSNGFLNRQYFPHPPPPSDGCRAPVAKDNE